MQVVVFGAGGYIGRHITEHLRQIGFNVICYSSASGNTFDLNTGLLADSANIPAGTNGVIYLSQSAYYRQMPEKAGHLWGVNVVSAIKAAEMARRAGVQRFIYASTGNVYAPSFLPLHEECPVRRDDWYALSKLHAEEVLALFRNDMSVTVARLFGVYGPSQTDKMVPNLAAAIRSGSPIKLAPNPDNELDTEGLKLSLCYIDDVVGIFSRLISQEGADVLNIAGLEALSIRDIALAIGDQLGIPPSFEIANQSRSFDLVADVTKLVGMFNPEFTPFAEGIRRTFAV